MSDIRQRVEDRKEERLEAYRAFARAHELWEAEVLNDNGPWFDQMPEPLREKFEEVQRLRNHAVRK